MLDEKMSTVSSVDGIIRYVTTRGIRQRITNHNLGRLSTVSTLVASVLLIGIVTSSAQSFVTAAAGNGIDVGGNEFGYVASTDVSNYLKLAYDVRDMRLANDDFTKKSTIYFNGSNVPDFSLQQLSYEAITSYQQTPRFQIYQDSFDWLGRTYEGDEIGQFDGKPVSYFADTLVTDLFQLKIPYIEATGSLVHNVLQGYWGNLWLVLNGCKYNDPDSMDAALDAAVALYIGSGQERNENNQGYMLYNLAENAGMFFNQDSAEATVNTETLELFLEIQDDISNDACADWDGYKSIRDKVQILYRNTNIFLMQWLLYHTQQYGNPEYGTGSDFIELFSLALWPQIHTCNRQLAAKIVSLTISADVTAETVDETIATLQQAFPCLHISCSDIGTDGKIAQCDDTANATNPISPDYIPSVDVRDISRLDRDINDISIFMKGSALDVALDYYQYGWHSSLYSLQDITINTLSWSASDYDDMLNNYYTNATMLDSVLTNFMTYDLNPNSAPVYESTTAAQQTIAVKGLLQGTVMYLGIIGTLESAINGCGEGDKMVDIRREWDNAAALYTGSMADPTGSIDPIENTGVSIWAMESKYCTIFNTCATAGVGPKKSVVLFELNKGLETMKDYNCDDTYAIVEEQIKPALFINLIQGYISNIMTVVTTGDSDDPQTVDDALAYAYAYSYALRPIINAVDDSTAEQLRSNTPFLEKVNSINASDAFVTIQNAIRLMQNIDCTAVGKYTYKGVKYGFCPNDRVVPSDLSYKLTLVDAPTAPTPSDVSPSPSVNRDDTPSSQASEGLAWGRYTFADVKSATNIANFLLDVRGMYFADTLEESDGNYTTSSSSITVGNGLTIKSLQAFSTQAYKFMNQDPIYNFFRLALFEDQTFDDPTDGDGEDYWAFENAIERLAIGKENGNSSPLAAETVIVLGVWHMIANMLYEASRQCAAQVNSDTYIDNAVALWIGQDQAEGQYNSGWSMYYVAQQAAKNLGFPEAEATLNEQLMNDLSALQALTKTCTTSATVGTKVRMMVDDIIKKLSIPLAQNLLYHMSANNFQYVELYALSVIPQGVSCDSGSFEYLRDSLFQGYSRQESLDGTLVHNLAKIFNCLRFQCDDFAIGTDALADNSTDLVDITKTLCDELDSMASAQRLTSYSLVSTGNDVMELSRLDLDVLQAELLARTGEYNLSYDIYQNGRNSRKSDGTYNTLQGLVTSPVNTEGQWYNLTTSYFGSATHSNDVIKEALRQTPPSMFAGVSRRQRAEIVFRTLQTSVTVRASIGRLYSALDSCKDGKDGSAIVDEAAALYIGSIEGPVDGGSEDNSGKFLFALAKEFCDAFNKCQNPTDAKSNELLVSVFREFRDSITAGECDDAENQLEETIVSQMQVPLLQALLYHADVNEGLEGSSLAETIAAGTVVSEAILPMIAAANATSNKTIVANMAFDISNTSVSDDKLAVFRAVSGALDGMKVDCNSVGSLVSDSLSLCPPNATNDINPNQTTTLGDDMYSSSTYVQDRADISKDIIEMSTALKDGRQDLAQIIYREGKNSPIYDPYGKRVDLRTLGSFSTNAADKMSTNPYFQTAVYALRDANNLFNGTDATKYADTIVQMAFAMGRSERLPLASEAAVALNLWMEIVGELFNAITSCMNGQLTNAEGLEAVDKVAAYWIGDGQISGSSETGHLLYALAEQMGGNFGETSEESKTNKNILGLFHETKMLFSPDNACLDIDTARKVRVAVDKIVSTMIIVPMQALIHYLRTNDQARTFIYGHAFVPLVAACRPSSFQYLKSQILDGTAQSSEIDKIVAEIRSTLPCFALTCADVGVQDNEQDSVCTDPEPQTLITGYKPSSDVRDYTKIDLDLLEMNILMQMEAYGAAEALYTLGKHVTIGSTGVAVSLQSLATDPGRSAATQYASFKSYYSNNEHYADTIIQNGLNSTIKMGAVQRRSVVVDTSKYMIMFMAVLQALDEAVNSCTAGNADTSATWDQAAAFLIGSLEGSNEAGSDDGQVFWQLSKVYCKEFNTCSNEVPGNSLNNDQIKTLLYAGSGAALSGNCDELKKATRNIASKMLVPLIQGSLSAAMKLTSYSISNDEKVRLQAKANSYTQALLPLIHDSNTRAAEIVSKNFPLIGPPMLDGRGAVVSAFSAVLSDLGVDCVYVGASSEVNVCTGESQRALNAGGIVGVTFAAIALVAVALFLIRRRRKRLADEKAEFLAPNGEFNHSADLLIVKTERGRTNGDAETHCLNNYADASMHDEDDDYVNAISRVLDERDMGRDNEEKAPNTSPVV